MSIIFRRETVMATLLDPRKDFAPVKHEMEFRYDPLTGRSTRLAHLGAIKPQPLDYPENTLPLKGNTKQGYERANFAAPEHSAAAYDAIFSSTMT
ncbi:MAG: hypothetical protein ACYCXI_08930, partial [Dethiobacteraceae bacterium]